MVNAGKGHVQHFQVGRSFHHLGGIGIVGDDGDVAVPRPADEFCRVGGLVPVGRKAVSLGFQSGLVLLQHLGGDAQRL